MEAIDPIQTFREALERARAAGIHEPEAMALATADGAGRPSVRMVLLKQVDERGFVFYTNLESRKGQELRQRPQASLCFHWARLEEQVRVEGDVVPVSTEEADAYFQSRPRGSRIGAWASRQSDTLPSREELEERLQEIEERFAGGEIPRPPFWSGFRIVPTRVEFWKGRPDRLHERKVFLRGEDGWSVGFLFP